MSTINMQFFNHHFEGLKHFYATHGHFQVPTHYEDDYDRKLGAWVARLRNSHHLGSLPSAKTNLLNSIGFEWENLNSTLNPSNHGKTSLIATPSRSQLLNAQTPNLKSPPKCSVEPVSSSSVVSMPSLQSDGSAKRISWEKNFSALERFKSEHGHLLPDFSRHKKLRLWVNKQQDLWLNEKLDNDQVRMLKEIGMEEPPDDDSDDEDSKAGIDDTLIFHIDDSRGRVTRSALKRKRETDSMLLEPAKAESNVRAKFESNEVAETENKGVEPSLINCIYEAISERVSTFSFWGT